MASAAEILSTYLAGFDLDGMLAVLGPELRAHAAASNPAVALLNASNPAALEDLLVAAAAEGIARLIDSASMTVAVEGLGHDASYEALARTVANVRWSLGMIAPPPDVDLTPEERAEARRVGISNLVTVVALWDESVAEAADEAIDAHDDELRQIAADVESAIPPAAPDDERPTTG